MTWPQEYPLVRTVPIKPIRDRDGIPDPDYFRKAPVEQTAKKVEGPAKNTIQKEKK